MTVSEAGRMGGEKRFEKLGPEGMSELGKKGGPIGGQVRKEQLGHEGYVELGKLGGETVKRELGSEFFSRIGRQGGKHSWTTGQGAAPHLTEEDKRRAEEICSRIERGEDVSIKEVAFLGGIERVMQASGNRNVNR